MPSPDENFPHKNDRTFHQRCLSRARDEPAETPLAPTSGDLTRMFPPANLLFVQSPSAWFNKSSTVCFHLTIKIRSCFIRSLEFAWVNNSAALTDPILSLDVFERLSSDLVLMSVIQSVITFFSESSLSLRSPSAGNLSIPYKSPDSPMLYGFFLRQQKVWYRPWTR